MKLLLTGFEPFGGESVNPATEVARQLAVQVAKYHPEHEVQVTILPTAFQAATARLQEVVAAFQPDVLVSLGQAGGRTSLTVERVAINLDDASIPDNAGAQPIDEVIEQEGAPAYFTTLPVKRLVAASKAAGVPAAVSHTAGTYVCNHIMYQGLHLARTRYPQMRSGFIHIPYLPVQVVNKPTQPSMAQETMVIGLMAMLNVLWEQPSSDLKATGGATH